MFCCRLSLFFSASAFFAADAAALAGMAQERRRDELRERQEQREREGEGAELEAMLRRLPPSVLDGSTACDNFAAFARSLAAG